AGGGPVGLGNDPDFRSVPEPVGGEDALIRLARQLVRVGILGAHLAPISVCVPREVEKSVLSGLHESMKRAGGRDHTPEGQCLPPRSHASSSPREKSSASSSPSVSVARSGTQETVVCRTSRATVRSAKPSPTSTRRS